MAAARDDVSSPVPHITFVELPKKWMVNNPQIQTPRALVKKAKATKKNSGGNVKAERDADADADADAKNMSTEEAGRQPKKMAREMEAWILQQRGIEVAPKHHFVRVEDLYALFVRTHTPSLPPSTPSERREEEEEVDAVAAAAAKPTTDDVSSQQPPQQTPERPQPTTAVTAWPMHSFSSCAGKVLNDMFPAQLTRRAGKLSITCDALPAVADNCPPKHTNKKEKKLAKWGPAVGAGGHAAPAHTRDT
jgi:hypothetical protein